MKSFMLFMLAAILFGCSNPMDEKITEENFEKVLESVRKKTDAKTFKKVQGVVMMAGFAKMTGKEPVDVLTGKSFNEHIKFFQDKAKQEEIKKKEKELKALQVAKAAADKVKEREEYLETVSWTKENNDGKYGYNKKIIIGINIKNKKDQDIDAFEGTIYIYDKLNNQLAKLGVKSTSVILAGKNSNLAWEFPTIDFNNKMNEVYSSAPGKLKFRFEPRKILLKNGTEI